MYNTELKFQNNKKYILGLFVYFFLINECDLLNLFKYSK